MDSADPESLLPSPVHDMVVSLGVEILDLSGGIRRGGKVISDQEILESQ